MTTECHILDADGLAHWRAVTGPATKDIGVVIGTFDMLQPGNLAALRAAKQQCRRVCVVLSPDNAIEDRPWNPLAERAEVLSYLRDVDAITSFSAENANEFVPHLQALALFSCPELPAGPLADEIRKAANAEHALPFLPGCSTADVVDSIRAKTTPIDVPPDVAATPHGESQSNGSTVTVNGCFDILHLGHFRFLAEARALGTELTVLLNDDDSVARYKGAARPVFPAHFRAQALSSLISVSRVLPFPEDNPLRVLADLKPDIHVKGGSFDETRANSERDLVESWGGSLEFCPLTQGHSTSASIERILANGP